MFAATVARSCLSISILATKLYSAVPAVTGASNKKPTSPSGKRRRRARRRTRSQRPGMPSTTFTKTTTPRRKRRSRRTSTCALALLPRPALDWLVALVKLTVDQTPQGRRRGVQDRVDGLARQGHNVGTDLHPRRPARLAVQDDHQEQAGPVPVQGPLAESPPRGRDRSGRWWVLRAPRGEAPERGGHVWRDGRSVCDTRPCKSDSEFLSAARNDSDTVLACVEIACAEKRRRKNGKNSFVQTTEHMKIYR